MQFDARPLCADQGEVGENGPLCFALGANRLEEHLARGPIHAAKQVPEIAQVTGLEAPALAVPSAVRFTLVPPDGALITMASPVPDMALGASIDAAPDAGLHGRHHRHQLQELVTWVVAALDVALGGSIGALLDAELVTLA